MATVSRADARHIVVRAVGIGRIVVVVVFCDDVVVAFAFGQRESTLAVRHPDAEFRPTERAKHNALVFRDL